MNNALVRINPKSISDIFWKYVYQSAAYLHSDIERQIVEFYKENEIKRQYADYNTGSVGLLDIFNLVCLTKFFSFEKVVEVGTFIGNSTQAIAYGCTLGERESVIHTCDYSNDIRINNLFATSEIVQYPKTSSTQMLTKLVNEGFQSDFVYLDGRLAAEDLNLLDKVSHEKTVIGFDDFEGIEKGVINLSMVAGMKKFGAHIHVAPVAFDVFQGLPIWTSTSTKSIMMLLIPPSYFSFTRQ